jgi:hypothetical protein
MDMGKEHFGEKGDKESNGAGSDFQGKFHGLLDVTKEINDEIANRTTQHAATSHKTCLGKRNTRIGRKPCTYTL